MVTCTVEGTEFSCGSSQSHWVYYLDLYASVTCIELVLLLISISIAWGCEMHLIDVNGAFLHEALLSKK